MEDEDDEDTRARWKDEDIEMLIALRGEMDDDFKKNSKKNKVISPTFSSSLALRGKLEVAESLQYWWSSQDLVCRICDESSCALRDMATR